MNNLNVPEYYWNKTIYIKDLPDRKLDKAQMLHFSTCQYINEGHHIILKGATGYG